MLLFTDILKVHYSCHQLNYGEAVVNEVAVTLKVVIVFLLALWMDPGGTFQARGHENKQACSSGLVVTRSVTKLENFDSMAL